MANHSIYNLLLNCLSSRLTGIGGTVKRVTGLEASQEAQPEFVALFRHLARLALPFWQMPAAREGQAVNRTSPAGELPRARLGELTNILQR